MQNAEEYYRAMFRGRGHRWNLRDTHMAETLDALLEHLGRGGAPPKIVVWAHNSHLGDARATEMANNTYSSETETGPRIAAGVMASRTVIVGSGSVLPPVVVPTRPSSITISAVARAAIDKPNEEILTQFEAITGIRERRYASGRPGGLRPRAGSGGNAASNTPTSTRPVIAEGAEGRAVVVAAKIESRHTITPYVRFGDWL